MTVSPGDIPRVVSFANTALARVPNGVPVAATVAIPDTVTLTPRGLGETVFPVAATVRWSVQGAGGAPVPPSSYRVVDGGFDRPTLTLVFVPEAAERSVTISANVEVGIAGQHLDFDHRFTVVVEPLDEAALTTLLTAALNDLVRPVAPSAPVPAGLFTLGLSALPSPEQPGSTLEVTRSFPRVGVKASIGLGEVIAALLQPFAALGAALEALVSPDSGGVRSANESVTGFLSDALAVPVTVDQRAVDIVRRALPDVTLPQPSVDLDGPAPAITVPVGAWTPALPVAGVRWTFEPANGVVRIPLASDVPDTGLLQTFLVLPRFGSGSRTVRATVHVDVVLPTRTAPVTLARRVDLVFPDVPVPAFAVATSWTAKRKGTGPRRYAVVVPDTSPPDLPGLLDDLTRLTAMLDKVNAAIAVARAAGAGLAMLDARRISDLTAVVTALTTLLAAAPDAVVHYYPAVPWQPEARWPGGRGPENVDWFRASVNDNAFLSDFLEDAIEATFFLAPGFDYVGLDDGDGDGQNEFPLVWATDGSLAWAVQRADDIGWIWLPRGTTAFGRENMDKADQLEAIVFGRLVRG